MPRISSLTSLTVPANDDELPIVDVSASVTKKITRAALLSGAPLPNNTVTTAAITDGSITAVKTAFGGNYSTSEVDTGFTWVNGSTIYKKTINFGSLPNNTSKDVAHAITGLVTVIDLSGVATSGTTSLPLPYSGSSTGTSTNSIQIARANTNIQILTGTDRTAYSAYVTIYYTKA